MQRISGLENSNPKGLHWIMLWRGVAWLCFEAFCAAGPPRLQKPPFAVLVLCNMLPKVLAPVAVNLHIVAILNLEAVHRYDGGYNSIQLGTRVSVPVAQSMWGFVEPIIGEYLGGGGRARVWSGSGG